MDHQDTIDRFVRTLQTRNSASTFSLYNENKSSSNVYKEVEVRDVMNTISKQIMAIKNADIVRNNVRKNDTLSNHKKCKFLPLTSLPVETPIDIENKFETQYELDTQLIDFVKKAEAQIQEEKKEKKEREAQEFNKSICQANENRRKDNADIIYDNTLREVELFNTVPGFTDDKNRQIVNNDYIELDVEDKFESPKSPILSKAKPISKPLVCTLDDFDKFETLAMPVLTETSDFDDAKRIINEELKAKKLFIPTHADTICDRDEQIYKCNVEDEESLDNDNLRTLYSFDVKHIDNNVEDAMLFDSDDDKDDLPLTCALEKKSYDNPGVMDKTLYVGFQTASNRSIQILADSFKKARSVFDDVSRKVAENTSITELVDALDGKYSNEGRDKVKKDLSKLKEEETRRNSSKFVQNVCKIKGNNICEKNVDSENKSVVENVANINNAYNNMTDHIDKDLLNEFETNMSDNELLETWKISKKRKSDVYPNEDKDCIESNKPQKDNKDVTSALVGFKSANNKRIKISEQALLKAKNIFDDININGENNIKLNSLDSKKVEKDFVGFKTANNKKITVSDQAVLRTKNIFDDIDQDLSNYKKEFDALQQSESKQLVGFKTASNKAVHISSNALEKSKKIFQEMNEKENLERDRIDLFKKLENYDKPIKIAADAFNIPNIDKNIQLDKGLNENALSGHGHKTETSVFQGFTTASNKPVAISKEALRKSKKIFQDITDNDCIQPSYVDDNTDQNPSQIKSNNLPIKTKCDNDLSGIIAKSSLKGFKTASEKHVDISKEALIKSKKNLENDIVNQNKENKYGTNCFVGFQTASNKSAKISKESLIKSKQILRDVDKVYENIEISDNSDKGFVGFQTANNKRVKISEEALLRSKKVFEDIDMKFEDGTKINGFCTASNKKVNISEEALVKSKKIFECLGDEKLVNEEELKNNIKSKLKTYITSDVKDINPNKFKEILPDKVNKETELELNVEDLFNTEVIRNFDETLHLEEFVKDTPKSKRSGSPILSCPRAKKKKFEPPKTIKRNMQSCIEIPKTVHVYKFKENYKKTKIYKLKNLSSDNSSTKDIDSYILRLSFNTLLDFRFDNQRNDIDSDVWSTDKIKKYFTDCVNGKIIPQGWIENHMRLIIWKLVSYEIFFGGCMKYVCSVKNVLQQLKYRYDRELYNVERPSLRKILEKDDVSTKLIVLCVASLYVDGVSPTNQTQNIELLLTDGWYCIKASTDRMIDKLVIDGKISVGTKLAIHGAELMNCDQGISPWEDTSAVRLKIFGNSTKRARWDARLGFHGNGAMLTPLTAVKLEGGKVSKMRVFVTRVYPTMYVEKFEDGSTVTRSERLEHLHQVKYETERQIQMEKLYEEVEKMTEQESQDSEQLTEQDNFDTGSQISRLMKKSKDPVEFKATLTTSQILKLNEHTHKQNEKLIHVIQNKVKDLMKKRGLDMSRNVVPLMKIRVADVCGTISKAMITIWRPNESLLDVIKEGTWIDVYNAVPTSIRYSEMQISAGRQTIFCKSKFNETDRQKTLTQTLIRKCYSIKDLHSSMTSEYNEVDTFGVVILTEPDNYDSNKQLFQNVYISGIDKHIISINFWGGVKKFGFENILAEGQVVACVNIQKRAGNTKNIPQYRATEFSYFTKTPKYETLKRNIDEFDRKYNKMDRNKFIQDCISLKNNYSSLKYDISPYRMNISEYNISKNKIFIESPVNKDLNLNLTGLDFESSFKELSPNTLRKKKVKEKIAKLKTYGEPPPLNLIHIRNKTAIIPYKSPLISDITTSAANTNSKNSNNVTSNKMSSPILNRTFVKINPVKLNFAMEDNKDLESPPLSLDDS